MRHYEYLPDDLAELTDAAFRSVARSFADEEVGGEAGAVLGVLTEERVLFHEALEAIGRAGEFTGYALERDERLAADDPVFRPMLSWRGRPLRRTSAADVRDVFDERDLEWARGAVEDGRIRTRTCDPGIQSDGAGGGDDALHGMLRIVVEVESSYYERRVYCGVAGLDLSSGSFGRFRCYDCDNRDDRGADDPPCRHSAAAVLAFVEDPGAFDGCPPDLRRIS